MVEIGPFVIRLYGVMVGLGILAGFWVASRFAREFAIRYSLYAIRSQDVWDALWWAVIPGIIGARLYHVVDLWGYYRENLALIPAVWTGGLGIFGAIFGGILGLWIFARRKGISFLVFSDLLAFGLPVGQAIGRWGNFFNQELYGLPTDLPWGLAIPLEKRLPGFEHYTHFHPLFLYESLYSILVFGILLILWRVKGGKLAPGSYFSMYLVMYGIGRFFLEGFRIESWALAGINIAQALSLLMLVSGVYYLYSMNRE